MTVSGWEIPPSYAAHPTAYIYVATDDSSGPAPVNAYDLDASGSVTPVVSIPDPDTANTFWDPWSLAFDSTGDLYVQSFLSDATTFVFAPGRTTPLRMFELSGPDINGIEVDAAGFETVIGGEGPPAIYVGPVGAAGTSSDYYYVRPVREVETGSTFYDPWPEVLANGPHGDILAALETGSGFEIATFGGGPHGHSGPLRVISGPQTGLDSSCSIGSCGVAITYSSATGFIYAAVTNSSGVHLSEFAGDASGNAAPVRTIAGPKTGFGSKTATGLAVDPGSGDLFVMVAGQRFGSSGRIEVFAAKAKGDVVPLRSFTDGSTSFVGTEGLAIGP